MSPIETVVEVVIEGVMAILPLRWLLRLLAGGFVVGGLAAMGTSQFRTLGALSVALGLFVLVLSSLRAWMA
jgi:hypothetical protein